MLTHQQTTMIENITRKMPILWWVDCSLIYIYHYRNSLATFIKGTDMAISIDTTSKTTYHHESTLNGILGTRTSYKYTMLRCTASTYNRNPSTSEQ